MMKLKALTNIDGVVKAFAGQEFEVTNLQQAKDLIQQGVAYSVDTQGQEVQNLLNASQNEEFWAAEVEAIRESEIEKSRIRIHSKRCKYIGRPKARNDSTSKRRSKNGS